MNLKLEIGRKFEFEDFENLKIKNVYFLLFFIKN